MCLDWAFCCVWQFQSGIHGIVHVSTNKWRKMQIILLNGVFYLRFKTGTHVGTVHDPQNKWKHVAICCVLQQLYVNGYSCNDALSNGSFSYLLSLCCATMSTMHFNAPYSSSSMNCTYPPNSKSSKQRKHNGFSFKQNKHMSTPLFFLHSCLPSLRLEHCCRHCGWEMLHLSVSCI